jgi:DnaJ-class molecular chaperone
MPHDQHPTDVKYYVTAKVPCPECRGRGSLVPALVEQAGAADAITVLCHACDGTGEVRMDAPFVVALDRALADFEDRSGDV